MSYNYLVRLGYTVAVVLWAVHTLRRVLVSFVIHLSHKTMIRYTELKLACCMLPETQAAHWNNSQTEETYNKDTCNKTEENREYRKLST